MSREVDPNNPKNQDDLRYLAERDQLSPEWVEACGGPEGVAALLNGEKIKVKRPKAAPAVEEETEEEETEDEQEDQASRGRARARTGE